MSLLLNLERPQDAMDYWEPGSPLQAQLTADEVSKGEGKWKDLPNQTEEHSQRSKEGMAKHREGTDKSHEKVRKYYILQYAGFILNSSLAPGPWCACEHA